MAKWLEEFRIGYRLAAARDGQAAAESELRSAVIQNLQIAARGGKVLPTDAEPIISVLQRDDPRKREQAMKAADWLLDPNRIDMTEAEAARMRRGLPRHLSPLEVLARS